MVSIPVRGKGIKTLLATQGCHNPRHEVSIPVRGKGIKTTGVIAAFSGGQVFPSP